MGLARAANVPGTIRVSIPSGDDKFGVLREWL